MPWPSLAESYRITDWSYFQAKDVLNRPYDIDLYCNEHPEVDGAVLRFCWPDGTKDQKYDHYYDGFTANGKIVMGYGWPNVWRTVQRVVDDWLKAMGNRVPKVIFGDWEEASSITGASAAKITDHMKALNVEKHNRIPVVHGEYSRAGWLDGNVIASAEIRALNWWLAHWIYPPPDFKDEAKSFSELDALLPIDNNFTPYRGKIVLIPEASVKGWQATHTLTMPRGSLDGGYFKRSFIDPIYFPQQPPQPPQPPAEKAIVKVKATVTQGAADIIYE